MEVKSTEMFYSIWRIQLSFEVSAGHTEHFRASRLQISRLSTPNQVPGRPVITSHETAKMLDTFGYPLKHRTKGGSLVNFM